MHGVFSEGSIFNDLHIACRDGKSTESTVSPYTLQMATDGEVYKIPGEVFKEHYAGAIYDWLMMQHTE